MTEPQRDLPPGLREQLDLPHAGLATFGHRPFLTEPEQLDSWQPDVAIVGAPFDISTTNRPGRPLRAPGHPHPGLRARDLPPRPRHRDLRLARGRRLRRRPLPPRADRGRPRQHPGQGGRGGQPGHHPGDPRRRPLDHLAGGHRGGQTTTASATSGIVHFDAHADTADIIDGNLASHGTPMRRLIESGAVLGRNFVQVGLRGYWPPEDVFEWMQEPGHALAPHARGVGAGHRRGDRGRGGRGARRRRPPLRQRRHRRARPRLRARHRHARARRA